jgi:hypothetical protein
VLAKPVDEKQLDGVLEALRAGSRGHDAHPKAAR